ncbi:hypothetical protein [Mesorhizobium silamurunense]|uniref:hypothetical protein n=1 Tax=Mesorhizobium silamurunense TaxID=499528 RepID=UPI001FEE8937|nr:hypothetical protein [Mesorhizobium silamurunense]
MSDLGQIRFLSESRPPAQSDCPIGQLALTPTIAHHHLVPIDRIRPSFAGQCHCVSPFKQHARLQGDAHALQQHSVPGEYAIGIEHYGALYRLKITRQGS